MLSFHIAERTQGSRGALALLRWALTVIFLWFGGMKFTTYEASAISLFVANSPLVRWMHSTAGIKGASYLLGVIELATAFFLIAGAFSGAASAIGAAMSTLTFAITLTFLLTTPGVSVSGAGSSLAISAPIGQFLLKDLVLLAASLVLLLASVQRISSLGAGSRKANSTNAIGPDA